jgi:ribonuclease Y
MMTSVVDLPSDDMKGRIIGREGRNIKAFERVTGADVIIDDTPNAITLSCFSPIRREVAKRTMEILIKDGRIQPARIEEAMQEAKKSLAVEIKKAGEDAVYEVGAVGLEPKLVQIVGRLKYRTSYGQNILRHSIETAHIAGVLAQELGADVTSAKLGGLLHDIGKAFDHDIQGTHVEIGINLGKKFGVNDKVMSAIAEHHDDVPTTLEGVIVKVADAISGARPGARSDTKENYIQRLRDLEEIANGFDGVDKAYAIQAGREIRVFVDAASVKDNHCTKIAQDMAKRIESSLKYPGEIKVNIIRETRTIEYAR